MNDPKPTPTLPTPAPDRPRLIPKLTHEELMERNRRVIAKLDEWEREGDPEEQRETMELLRRVLGPERIMSSRPAFAPEEPGS